ncbi:MAG: trypsin-like serine protease [Proteobacteria bacterium]|nr:trypsin-like serine protease [Pseudomonadota bacterium]
MTISAFLALTLATASAQDTGFEDTGYAPPPVVGGSVVQPGNWLDTVLVSTRDSVCTGTLIGPQTVLTAAHCNENNGVQGVVVGTTNYYDQSQGDWYPASSTVNHPSYGNDQVGGFDIAVIRLQQPVQGVQPRAFAVDCSTPLIQDGAAVHIVGFGSDRADGGGQNSQLKEASTVITDHDCSEDWYCSEIMPPLGEMTAGANGVDSCFGDSGGPLYLQTPQGYTLLGVVSRASYAAQQTGYACGGNGIYTRADTFIDWIQQQTTDPLLRPQCNASPIVEVESFGAVGNKGNSTTSFTITDPDSTSWTFELPVPPANGLIEIPNDSTLRYVGDGVYEGRDQFTFRVVDDYGNATDVVVPLVVVDGNTCGCATGAEPMGLWSLGLAGLVLLRRRRE